MRIKWRGLELPSQVSRDDAVSTKTYGRFVIEPFERGFGTTIGNSLRRVLLSSLDGAAVYRVKIHNAPHEFMSLTGVLEDVTDIILNVKGLIVKSENEESVSLSVERKAKGEIRAADIATPAGIEILNPELVVATLTNDVPFKMELDVRTGRGYATASENGASEQEVGVIPVDSTFSPVTRVRYQTEDTRVGQRVNFDRLILEVWTKGTLSPEDALVEASKILRKHLNPFVQYHDLDSRMVLAAAPVRASSVGLNAETQKLLQQPISDLDLSVRASNCLEAARILTVEELVQKTEGDLLRLRSFGKTSLREIRRKLSDIGLSLGMNTPEKHPPTSADDEGHEGRNPSSVGRDSYANATDDMMTSRPHEVSIPGESS